jgi:hypothetical protein
VVSGDVTLEICYDAMNRWCVLSFMAKDIAVGFGLLSVFRYKLRALEQWHEGRRVSAA